jgi:hypothetical protein
LANFFTDIILGYLKNEIFDHREENRIMTKLSLKRQELGVCTDLDHMNWLVNGGGITVFV